MNRRTARVTPRDVDRLLKQTADKFFGKPMDYGSCRPVCVRYSPSSITFTKKRPKP